ncbi:MAG: VWA domain-containing protein [Solirubrobacteraceae bacterium]
MSFQWPMALLALLLIPAAAVAYVLLERRRRAGDTAQFASPAIFPNVVGRSPGRLRHVPVAVLLIGVAVLVTGFARPRATHSVKRNEATVMLAVDVSRSMTAKDVKPTRLAAAGDAIARFLDVVPDSLRVGVVTFADRAAVAAPPTHDREVVRAALREARPGEGTALGDALVLALRSARSVRDENNEPPPASILVISDGAQTQGAVTPKAAAQRAKTAGVPIFTVVIGTPNGIVTRKLTGGFTERVRVPPDPQALRDVAVSSGGESFSVADDTALQKVYKELGTRLGHEKKQSEVTAAFAGAGMLLLLASGALSAALFRRLP